MYLEDVLVFVMFSLSTYIFLPSHMSSLEDVLVFDMFSLSTYFFLPSHMSSSSLDKHSG